MEIWKTAAHADGKAIHNLMEKDKPFPTGLQTALPQLRNPGSLRTFPQGLLRRLFVLFQFQKIVRCNSLRTLIQYG